METKVLEKTKNVLGQVIGSIITYNGIDYDGVLINFILMNSNLFWEKLVAELKRISDEIINEKKYFFKYRHDNFFNQIDLLRMLFSKELRVG